MIVAACASAGTARAVAFGPFAVASPSALVPESGPGAPLSGSISLDVASVPVAAPTLLRLTDVAVAGGGASYALDPALASPSLGAVQASGDFVIPTLFLRVDDGVLPFDLAIPDVTGRLFFDAGGAVVGLASSFAIDSGTPAGIVTVQLVAGVPEPGTAALVTVGIGALVASARHRPAKEAA